MQGGRSLSRGFFRLLLSGRHRPVRQALPGPRQVEKVRFSRAQQPAARFQQHDPGGD